MAHQVCLMVSVVVLLLLNLKGIDGFHEINNETSLESKSFMSVSLLGRPMFHFRPPFHWINDPNGPVYYKGLYHLFYQYNPNGSVWGNIVWAHSVSKDLVNWESLEPALSPSKWFDIGGAWSGSITLVPGKGPVILYTGVDRNRTQMQNYAIPEDPSDPYLRKWIKPEDNPIAVPDSSMDRKAFRDPTTAWFSRDDRHWRTVVGAERNDTGVALLYRSKDFKKWIKAKHPIHSKPSTGMWECPDLFPVSATQGLDLDYEASDTKYVLKVSLNTTRFEYYTLGMYDRKKDRYIPDGSTPDGWSGLRLDYGNFYASKSFFDYKKNRRLLWGWANESDTRDDDVSKQWAGIQLIPRTVLLDTNKRQLVFWPVEEIESLRGNYVRMTNLKMEMGQRIEVKGITPAQADVDVTFFIGDYQHNAEVFDPSFSLRPFELCHIKGSNVTGGVGPFGLIALATADLEEYTPVFFRVFKDSKTHKPKILMCSDARASSLKGDNGTLPEKRMYKPSFGGFVDSDLADGRISLRSLIDHSVIESFGALGKVVITSRVYPRKAVKDKAHLYVFNNGTQTVRIESLAAWNMEPPQHMNDGYAIN